MEDDNACENTVAKNWFVSFGTPAPLVNSTKSGGLAGPILQAGLRNRYGCQ
jgi:hypothetical protein